MAGPRYHRVTVAAMQNALRLNSRVNPLTMLG
jgi:hypothetical protein